MSSDSKNGLEPVSGFNRLDLYKITEGQTRGYELEYEDQDLYIAPSACGKIAELAERLNDGEPFYNAICRTYSRSHSRKTRREEFEAFIEDTKLKEDLEEDFKYLQEVMEEAY